MKRIIVFLLVSTICFSGIMAQELPSNVPVFDSLPTEPYESQEILIPEVRYKVTVNYVLSTLSYSSKGKENGSILTWRDIRLQGAEINVDISNAPFGFDRANIGISYSSSFHGYMTDDYSDYYVEKRFDSLEVDASLLSFSYELRNENNRINLVFGMDFNCLWMESKYFYSPTSIYKGIVNTFDIYKLGLYGGLQSKLVEGSYGYIKITGLVGVATFLNLADLVINTHHKHPVSFFDFGFAPRISTELETAFNMGRVSVFAKAQLLYEICPVGIEIHRYSDGTIRDQSIFSEFMQSSFGFGIMIRF